MIANTAAGHDAIQWGEQAEDYIRRRLDEAGITFGMNDAEIQRRLALKGPLPRHLCDFPAEFWGYVHPGGKLLSRLKVAHDSPVCTVNALLKLNKQHVELFESWLEDIVTPERYSETTQEWISGATKQVSPGVLMVEKVTEFAADGGAKLLKRCRPETYTGPVAWDFGAPLADEFEPNYWRGLIPKEFRYRFAMSAGMGDSSNLEALCLSLRKTASELLRSCLASIQSAGWAYSRAIAHVAETWWETKTADTYARSVMPMIWKRVRQRANEIWEQRRSENNANEKLIPAGDKYDQMFWIDTTREKVELIAGELEHPLRVLRVFDCHLEALHEAPAVMAREQPPDRLEAVLWAFQAEARRRLRNDAADNSLFCASAARRQEELEALAGTCATEIMNAMQSVQAMIPQTPPAQELPSGPSPSPDATAARTYHAITGRRFTSWAQIKIKFVNGDTVRIELQPNDWRDFQFTQMGMVDGRNGRAAQAWIDLRDCADKLGQLKVDRQRRRSLAKALKAFFEIEENPFVVDQRGGCRPRFDVKPEESGPGE